LACVHGPAGTFQLRQDAIGVYKDMSRVPIDVVELPQFQRLARDLWDDAEREAFVDFIARDPEAGDVIPGTGGSARFGGTGEAQANVGGRG
jgi:hypothetical protein